MNCVKPEFPEQALSFFESVLVTLERWSRGEHPMRGYNVIDDPGNRALKAPDVVKTLAWMLPKAQVAYRDLSEFLHVYSPPLGDPKWCSTPTAPAATAEPAVSELASAHPEKCGETLCACKDRPASQCDEEWGPNCDMGNNDAHVRRAPEDSGAAVDATLGIVRASAGAASLAPREDTRMLDWLESKWVRSTRGDFMNPPVMDCHFTHYWPGKILATKPTLREAIRAAIAASPAGAEGARS